MHYIKKSFLIFILCSTSFFASSQEGELVEISDFETWTSAGVALKVNDTWKFSLSEELRLKSNSQTVDTYFTNFGAKYSFPIGIQLGAGLRYIRENDDKGKIQGYETHFRYNFDLGYKYKFDRLKLGLRLRYQNKNELGLDDLVESYAINKFRLKLASEYNIPSWKLDPKLAAELFYRTQETTESKISRIRITLGTGYDLKKFGKINAFYRIERELNPTYVDYPKTTYIVGLNYVYTFKL